MELFVVIVAALAVALIVRFTTPGRSEYGLALLPALSIAVAALSWTLSLLLGLEANTIFPWLISIGLSLLTSVLVARILAPKRAAARQAELDKLIHSRAV